MCAELKCYGLDKMHFEYINVRLMWTSSALHVVLVLKYPLFPSFQFFLDFSLKNQAAGFLFSKIPLVLEPREKQQGSMKLIFMSEFGFSSLYCMQLQKRPREVISSGNLSMISKCSHIFVTIIFFIISKRP